MVTLSAVGIIRRHELYAHWSTSGCNEWARLPFTELQIPRYAYR
jgi:hypothetical protein